MLLEAPGEGGELAEVPSCSAPAPLPSACPSSSPGGSAESLGMQQGVRISFRSHPLSPASGREVQWICSAGWKGQRRCSSVSQPQTFSGPLLLQNFLWAHVCPSTWNEDLPLCFSNCTALTVKFPAPYPSLVFVKPLKNIMSEMLHFH